ncbi:MAG: undecaprenyl-diphosphate phosphatase [Gemmatimonadaceae bacterium]
MTAFQALVLGIIQGLAEFLPISSSAHLALAPWIFGWPEPGLAFDVALHVGTLAAVLWFFQDEWLRLVRAALDIARKRRVETETEWRVIYLILATIPAAAAGALLDEYAETTFRNPVITGTALILMGAILWAVDRRAPRGRNMSSLGWTDAVLIGLAQVVALVPGVSRSGATISAGRGLRLDRESAAVFSFLMSMPITAAAAAVKVPEVIRESGFSIPLVIGVVASGLSGWLAITVLLRYVSRHSFGVFAVYRLILGGAVLLIVALRD